jgi:hypothetical protein
MSIYFYSSELDSVQGGHSTRESRGVGGDEMARPNVRQIASALPPFSVDLVALHSPISIRPVASLHTVYYVRLLKNRTYSVRYIRIFLRVDVFTSRDCRS